MIGFKIFASEAQDAPAMLVRITRQSRVGSVEYHLFMTDTLCIATAPSWQLLALPEKQDTLLDFPLSTWIAKENHFATEQGVMTLIVKKHP